MFVLINTFVGIVISRHYTLGAANRAQEALQRAVKKHNSGAYLPTKIVFMKDPPKKGSDWEEAVLMEIGIWEIPQH
ncbi:MAG: hypothetical protein CMJ75_22875 [Planctomycetaceae bacterium]|nr:hypothetical protein [Planctomycetaceae bacterium]